MSMSRNITSDVDRMITGIEVQEAVDLVVAYIRKTQRFHTMMAAHIYWDALTADEKLDVLRKALG